MISTIKTITETNPDTLEQTKTLKSVPFDVALLSNPRDFASADECRIVKISSKGRVFLDVRLICMNERNNAAYENYLGVKVVYKNEAKKAELVINTPAELVQIARACGSVLRPVDGERMERADASSYTLEMATEDFTKLTELRDAKG